MGDFRQIGRGWSFQDWALLAFALLSAVYLATKLHAPWALLDVDCFWYAGWLWDHGFSPYGAAFDQHKAALFAGRDLPAFFVYPPHIWSLVAPVGLVGNRLQRLIWAAMNLGLFLSGFVLWWRLVRGRSVWARRAILLLAISTCLFTGTNLALLDGQTTFLVWFGFALLAVALAQERPWMAALALTILLLKPQIGVVAAIAVVVDRWDVRLAARTVALVVLASLPALLIGGIRSLADFVNNIGGYQGLNYNRLEAMSGVGNLIAHWLHRHPSPFILELCAIVMAVGVTITLRRCGVDRMRTSLIATISAVALLVPLHTYDLTFVPVVALLLIPPAGWAAWAVVAPGFLMFARPENLDRLPMIGNFGTIVTLGMLFLLVVPIFAHIRRFPRGSPLLTPGNSRN